jgi:hypothetical protein
MVASCSLTTNHHPRHFIYNCIPKSSQYSWTAWPSNMGCPETSVTDCQSALRKIPEERRSPFHGSGRLKSRTSVSCFTSRSLRNEVTFMVVLGDCCNSLVDFLQCRHNLHGSSATNPSYCPEGVLPKVKAAGERIRHTCAQCQNRWCMALCHDSGCSALSLSVLCATIVRIDLWICDVCERLIIIAWMQCR